MLALTLIRPWSCALARGPKPIENRSWSPPLSALGQLVAFHGGKKWDEDAAHDMIAPCLPNGESQPRALWPEAPRTSDESPMGVVGVGRLIGVYRGGTRFDVADAYSPGAVARYIRVSEVFAAGRAWYVGGDAYGWIFDERRALKTPVPCRGAQGLWQLPGDVEAAVRKQLFAESIAGLAP